MKREDFCTLLGIRFFTGTTRDALARAREGGLTLAPSGPGLADLPGDPAYREALENADLVLPDSGFMVLALRLLGIKRLKRLSGLKFLQALLVDESFRGCGSMLWVMPNAVESEANLAWLQGMGIKLEQSDCYVAPDYALERVEDHELKALAERMRPRFIIINIGGGVQEKLGYYLIQGLDYRPAIICTGAAIAFLTGRQADIPVWADRLYLGWILRCLRAPRVFLPRYWKARRLFFLLWKYREKSPR